LNADKTFCACASLLHTQVKRILASGTAVRFNIRVRTEFGQVLVVVGGCAALGAWNVDNALRLNWQEGHIWETGVELPAG
jgi:tartrate dehydratase beta subunit/fumarate hydratase class I family protein